MATAKIIFAQAPGGTRLAGEAVDDGVAGNLVTVTNENDTGVGPWKLELVGVPDGPETDGDSALPLGQFASGIGAPVTGTFLPDVLNSYAVKLTVNGTIVDISTFSVPNELGWFRPPFEAVADMLEYGGQLRGWTYIKDRIERDVRRAANKTGTLVLPFDMIVGNKETDQTSSPGVVFGARELDPLLIVASISGLGLVREIRFKAILSASPGMTAELDLFNQTDAGVVGSALSTALSVPTALQSAVLAVPGDLPNLNKLYLARLRISAGSPGATDRAFCHYAGIEVKLTG